MPNAELDDLWTTQNGNTSWYDTSPPEVQAFLNELAVLTIEKGRRPSPTAVLEKIKQEWPEARLCHRDTLRDTIDRLVKAHK